MSVDWNNYSAMESGMTDMSWPEKGETLKVGDSVEGRYILKKEDVGRNKSNVYVLEDSDGRKIGVWGSTVLDTKFEQIAIGKMVAIEYVGEKEGKKGNIYKDFKVGCGIIVPGDESK